MIPYPPAHNWPVTPQWQLYPGIFTPEECLGLAPSIGPRQVAWDNTKARWLFDRVTRPITKWNESVQLDLYGVESLRIAAYPAGSGVPWRMGFGAGAESEHKVGILVSLSTPESRKGGAIGFFENDARTSEPKLGAGDALVIPAWMQYRISPVTEGSLWSLEAWFLGPPLR